jgi:hypothetical protein
MTTGWIISAVLIGLFGIIAIGHAFCLIRFLAGGVAFSVIPLLGGVLGAVGFWMAPAPALRHFWWLPLLLDYGSIPSAVSWLVFWAKVRRG